MNASGFTGYTPLHYAARERKAEVVEVPITSIACVERRSLTVSACLQLLLKSGGDANARSDSQQTPLHRVAWGGGADVARVSRVDTVDQAISVLRFCCRPEQTRLRWTRMETRRCMMQLTAITSTLQG